MNREKWDPEYPIELESQFILRLPEEPAKALREVLNSGENFKNRLTIQLENDMRHGEVRFDHWLLHGKIVDLPTIIESLKTIDRKSVYKTADICQMMICKYEPDIPSTEEESPAKNKKKDPLKVDKKFLFSHGITPPTKNVRKRRFRKTLKKKSAEAPEIEKEVKRLLRADNEAVSYTWEIIQEEEQPSTSNKAEKAGKTKREQNVKAEAGQDKKPSNVEDIFGGALSDSDLEDENVNIDMEDSRMSSYDDHISDMSVQSSETKGRLYATQFSSEMFLTSREKFVSKPQPSKSSVKPVKGEQLQVDTFMSSQSSDNVKEAKLQQLKLDIEELKQRKQRTQLEISGMENMTLRQRFQEILQTINKDIMFKEMEYQNLLK